LEDYVGDGVFADDDFVSCRGSFAYEVLGCQGYLDESAAL
jgi:hypothetical protein